ncbi:PP2C family protein-serine/threonine phosphatase [Massilia glaciei]|uniref:Serine/threonine-protein phosphatase n=1 Tax=Massilia glaciei TaxID=1524097 RepID=A0A2U2I6A5_9BURK|nr:PP2C family serine/threonine-protein phosphatase [Massilia glaciei]PWF55298.1 serine/threonine-protein phosphatase [Massilia glaciei]
MNEYKIEAGTAQHIGNRAQQTDRTALFTGARAPGYVLAVLADGMTGGASASEQVLQSAKQMFDEFKPGDRASTERLSQLLRDMVQETHSIIRMNTFTTKTEAQSSFVALVISPFGEAVWAHTGDSRLYRFAGGQCKARTSDEAYVNHLVEAEKMPLEAAKNHRRAKTLVNALGNAERKPFATVGVHGELAAGDTFLLCSDGLWSLFTDAELGAVTAKNTPRQASELLINKAAERAQGKGDNCTMAIVKLVRPPAPAGLGTRPAARP